MIDWPAQARHVYLSPHLDDAVLSCGGLIASQAARGESVAVITFFAGSPPPDEALSEFAGSLHQRWQVSAPPGLDFSDPPARRREEDRCALAELARAVEGIYGAWGDCIYRRDGAGRALYDSEAAIFGLPDEADPALSIATWKVEPPPGQMIYLPLAIGGHVDHRLLRRVVESWGLSARQCRYYEDYPYAARPGAIDALTRGSGLTPEVLLLTEAALAAKIRSVACYRSQISSFWASDEEMNRALRNFAASRGGEVLWRPSTG